MIPVVDIIKATIATLVLVFVVSFFGWVVYTYKAKVRLQKENAELARAITISNNIVAISDNTKAKNSALRASTKEKESAIINKKQSKEDYFSESMCIFSNFSNPDHEC